MICPPVALLVIISITTMISWTVTCIRGEGGGEEKTIYGDTGFSVCARDQNRTTASQASKLNNYQPISSDVAAWDNGVRSTIGLTCSCCWLWWIHSWRRRYKVLAALFGNARMGFEKVPYDIGGFEQCRLKADICSQKIACHSASRPVVSTCAQALGNFITSHTIGWTIVVLCTVGVLPIDGDGCIQGAKHHGFENSLHSHRHISG